MYRILVRLVRLVSVLLASCALLSLAQAQTWPAKPIRFVVGFPAGSTTDAVARVLADHLRNKLGQPVIVENKPGANGILAASEVAKASADGYTVLVTNSSGITVNPQLYKKIAYKASDFAPISMVVASPFLLVVNPQNERIAAAQTAAQLFALARNPAMKLTYGSGGPGNLAHLGMEMLNARVGVQATHVPYKGGVAAQLGLLGKEIDYMLDTPLAITHIKAGKLRPLAVTGLKRWPDLPQVPTLAEAGMPELDLTFWLGVLVPVNTPMAIQTVLGDAIRAVRDDANAVKQLQLHGQLELTTPANFAQRIASETATWGEIIRRENLALD
jgi:tripartite-type tricarboxylate transporter receptor subunit TctC